MRDTDKKQQEILKIFLQNDILNSSRAYELITATGKEISLITVKRYLSRMAATGLVAAEGEGRSRSYRISALGRILSEIDAREYCAREPDERYGLRGFNFELLPAMPNDVFTSAENKRLYEATKEYRRRISDLSPAIEQKELERMIIEFAWKSSKIEGNTYTLLDTEKLIKDRKEAPGHDKKEAIMLLNHKEAFLFARKRAKEFKNLTPANLEHVHRILVKDMGVGFGFRAKPVGVLGSKYMPLDNAHQVRETVDALCAAVSRARTPYMKSFLALLGLSYIQPFEDGNKRTARLMANALLLAHHCAPLSYRSVNEREYTETMLTFYELNSVVPFKHIFLEQYEFAAKNYAVSALN